MILPAILGLSGLAAFFSKRKPAGYNVDPTIAAQRRTVYEAALNCKNPTSLREISAAFRKEGCHIEADQLDRIVGRLELAPEVLEQRRIVFKKLMASTDPIQVRDAAIVFEQNGCPGAAANLVRYAQGLEDAEKLKTEDVADAASNQ